MRTIIDNRTYKTEAGMNKAIDRETAKNDAIDVTTTANDDGTFSLTVIERDEAASVEVEIPRDANGNIIIIDETPEEKAEAEAAIEAAKAEPVAAKIVYPVTCSIQRRHLAQIEAVAKAVKIARRRSNAILPAFNCPAFDETHPRYRGPNVRESSKVGQIVQMGAGMGVRASEIMDSGLFVKKNGIAWDPASIDCVFRWDTPAKGYSVQCVEDPAGVDHVYVVRARGLEVDDLSAVAEHHGYQTKGENVEAA